MNRSVDFYIAGLADHAVSCGLCGADDRTYVINGVLEVLGLHEFTEPAEKAELTLEELLSGIIGYAVENGVLENDSVVLSDLLDTKIMGVFTPRPSEVIRIFREKYKNSPKDATDWFYRLCLDCDYIRENRIKKDLKWTAPSVYGELDVTINLSKPEKDPRMVAALKNQKPSGYPLCNLCHENEGYEGSLNQPARQTLRQIPLDLDGYRWYLQYSPYSYYNEHCIVLSDKHSPMKVEKALMDKALAFVEQFPHYFIGSNADLPIVGGSILTHEHMQGGCYEFAMVRAEREAKLVFKGFEDVEAGIVKWPLSVIRLSSPDRKRLSELGDKILAAWREYTDEAAFVFAETAGEQHNTITPIARKKGDEFELDLVLRNNITTDEHPLGVYHPHAELHNIKKENIGLIEVMGLAVLPARLKKEMAELADMIIEGRPVEGPHREWYEKFADKYVFTKDNVHEILRAEIGKTFVRVLEDAGVYKCTKEGRAAFMRFVDYVNNK